MVALLVKSLLIINSTSLSFPPPPCNLFVKGIVSLFLGFADCIPVVYSLTYSSVLCNSSELLVGSRGWVRLKFDLGAQGHFISGIIFFCQEEHTVCFLSFCEVRTDNLETSPFINVSAFIVVF